MSEEFKVEIVNTEKSFLSKEDVTEVVVQDLIRTAEEQSKKTDISDQSKYLVDQKIDVLRSIN